MPELAPVHIGEQHTQIPVNTASTLNNVEDADGMVHSFIFFLTMLKSEIIRISAHMAWFTDSYERLSVSHLYLIRILSASCPSRFPGWREKILGWREISAGRTGKNAAFTDEKHDIYDNKTGNLTHENAYENDVMRLSLSECWKRIRYGWDADKIRIIFRNYLRIRSCMRIYG